MCQVPRWRLSDAVTAITAAISARSFGNRCRANSNKPYLLGWLLDDVARRGHSLVTCPLPEQTKHACLKRHCGMVQEPLFQFLQISGRRCDGG